MRLVRLIKGRTMKKTKLIPFGILPAAWGLRGKSRDLAEAEYYLTGETLERRIAEIELNGTALAKALLKLDKKYNHISDIEYDRKYADQFLEGKDKAKALLDISKIEGEIDDTEYEKQLATINNESWVKIVHVDAKGSFEFDWNELFIEELEEAGFGPAPKEEMVVDEWFNEICKNITIEQYQGDVALLAEQIDERQPNLVQTKRVAPGKREVK